MDLSELAMMLESIGNNEVTKEEFDEAANKLSSYNFLSNDQKLQFYGLYKQSTIGDVNIPQPWSINMVAKAKWDAWKHFEGFPVKSAQIAYVFLVNQLDQENNISKENNETKSTEKLSAEEKSMLVGVSLFATPLKNENVTEDWSTSEEIFTAVVNGDVDNIRKLLESGVNPSLSDSEQMTPLHFAVDRGYLEIVKLLIQNGANVNQANSDGQTPLMIAVTCEHFEIIKDLLNSGADLEIRDNEGLTVRDMVNECGNSDIQDLFR